MHFRELHHSLRSRGDRKLSSVIDLGRAISRCAIVLIGHRGLRLRIDFFVGGGAFLSAGGK